MTNPASIRLKQNVKRIMQLWEARVRDEVSALRHQDSLVLQDSLLQYLNQLVDALSAHLERTPARAETVKVNSVGLVNGMDGNGQGMPTTPCINSSSSTTFFVR
jgi:hypothetical protein